MQIFMIWIVIINKDNFWACFLTHKYTKDIYISTKHFRNWSHDKKLKMVSNNWLKNKLNCYETFCFLVTVFDKLYESDDSVSYPTYLTLSVHWKINFITNFAQFT